MAVDVFLNFNGNCREAVEFYAKAFKAEKQRIMTFADAPPNPDFPLPTEAENLVLYTCLNIHGNNLMFSDIFPGMPFVMGNNVNLSVSCANMDEIQCLFNQLKEGGTVDMDLQKTFWSECFASLIDKFGVHWQLNYAGEQT